MDLLLVIAAIKERCESYGGRVSGAAEFTSLPPNTVLPVPAAFVITMDDDVGDNRSENGYLQSVWDRIAVVVAIDNTPDQRGQAAINMVKDLRKELWGALLGWPPDEDHGGLEYDGGQLMRMDRARMFYQFEFRAETEINESETWQGHVNVNLPKLERVSIKVDAIDPFDPNRAQHGPDGTLEAEVLVVIPQV